MAEKIGFGSNAPPTPSPSHHITGNVSARYASDSSGDGVLDIATNLCDFNAELLTLVEMLRSRVLELERENSRLYSLLKESDKTVSEGDDTLIRVLQAEIADLERQLHQAKAARKSAEATSEALETKAKILSDVLSAQVGL